jgi:hypothetical protein
VLLEYELGLIVGLTSNECGTVSFHVCCGRPEAVKVESYFMFQIYSLFIRIGILDVETVHYHQAAG